MLGVWVDLGTELGVVLLRMEALVRVERERRKRAIFCRREEEELGALSSGCSLFFWTTKGGSLKEEMGSGFNRGPDWVSALGFLKSLRRELQLAKERWPANDWQLMPQKSR